MTDKVIREDHGGPTAVQTKLGWILAMPVEGLSSQAWTHVVTTHSMAVDPLVRA